MSQTVIIYIILCFINKKLIDTEKIQKILNKFAKTINIIVYYLTNLQIIKNKSSKTSNILINLKKQKRFKSNSSKESKNFEVSKLI